MNKPDRKQTEIINQLKREIRQLKKDKQQLEYIIDSLPGHVYWYDLDNIYRGCNKLQATDAGFTSTNEMLGKTNDEMPWKDHADVLNNINNRVMNTGKTHIAEEPSHTTRGYRIFLTEKKPLRDADNNITGVLGISLDITERKRIEEKLKIAKQKAELANVAKTEFIANISHDIRTPLSGIIGMASLLQKQVRTKSGQQYVKNINQASHRLLYILNEVIEFSKIESGQLPTKKVVVNLRTIIDETINLIFNHNRDKLAVNFYYPDDIPDYVITDDLKLHRIILNLLSNANKFTHSGEVAITVKLIRSTATKATIQLTVLDTGIGIPEDKIGTIFEKFVKLSSSYQGEYEGSGLGLPIVKRFIDDLKGDIAVVNNKQGGVTFTCTIPFAIPSKQQITQYEKNNTTTIDAKHNKLNILLIEDDKLCQLAEQAILEESGYKITLASNGAEALKLAQTKFDLIVTDIGLPDIDGFDLAKQLRKKNAPNQKTPIIALTAHISDKLNSTKTRHSVDHITNKPLDKNRINKLINKIFS